MSNKTYNKLIERVKEISYLGQIGSLLRWDQETYMPKGSINDRAMQISIMSGITHERQTSKEIGKMLDELEKAKDLNEDQGIIVREVRHDFEREIAIPAELVKEISKTETMSMEAWVKARKASDFKSFEPWLEKMIGLKLQVAEHIGFEDRPYDALLDGYEPSMHTKDVEIILSALRERLVPLVGRIIKAATEADIDDTCLYRKFDVEQQAKFYTGMVKDLGYSFETGRMDITTHPFTIGESSDIRITTRYDDDDIRPGLFACIHEAGHGIYEQGHLERYHHTPLGVSASLGIHESQSRLYENVIGRGRPFWQHYFPPLQSNFPVLKDVTLDGWYRAINMVKPSFIRVEADEVTYNLHILLRFEVELAITDGRITASEIPALWNEKMERYLGITPPDDAKGCLQDIHWSFGLMGYFPTYTLGNLLALQLYDTLMKDVPNMDVSISKGDFSPLLDWLREKVHRNGRRYMYNELTERTTGSSIDTDHFISYLKRKYSSIFDTQL